MDKRRLSTALATRVVNPLVRWAVRRGLAPRSYAILETTGRRIGLRLNALVGRAMGTDLLTVRIDLDREGS